MPARRMYPEDYTNKVPNNFGVDETKAMIQAKTLVNWVNDFKDWSASDTWRNFNPDCVRNGILTQNPRNDLGVY